MHQHTLTGERILASSPALGTLGPIVRATHERWDGAGYPDGLVRRSPFRRASSPFATPTWQWRPIAHTSGRDRSDRPSSSFARAPARSSTPPSSRRCARKSARCPVPSRPSTPDRTRWSPRRRWFTPPCSPVFFRRSWKPSKRADRRRSGDRVARLRRLGPALEPCFEREPDALGQHRDRLGLVVTGSPDPDRIVRPHPAVATEVALLLAQRPQPLHGANRTGPLGRRSGLRWPA